MRVRTAPATSALRPKSQHVRGPQGWSKGCVGLTGCVLPMSEAPSQFILISVENQDSIERNEQCIPPSPKPSPQSTSRTRGASPPNNGGSPKSPATTIVEAVDASRDTSRIRARVTSSHFVGRTGELAELELALREAAGESPVVVLLSGDSGVGKTRLIREFERRATAGDALVLRGEAVEEADGELPYAPVIGALRPLVRARHPALDALGRGSRAQLAALLPGLDEESGASDVNDPSAQVRLFEALLELLDVLSEERPVVLVLEDLHWGDRSTRTFVDFLARSLRGERVVLLLSYRTDELHRRHPFRTLLSELDRLERARRIALEPFDREELAEVLADILGEAPSEKLVQRLFERSEGNPLYSEELLAAGLDGRGAAPQSLRDAFMLRIERLSPDAQSAARVIAAGRALDEPMIAEVSGIEPDALHVALREAVSEQVLVACEPTRLSFRHALLREALYDDLLPGERSELHLALARAFEDRADYENDQGVELASAIARHYATAGDQPAALRATVQAALAAREVHAYGDAADLAERALELWPGVPDADKSIPLDHVKLLGIAAAAHGVVGDRGRSEVLLTRALKELDPDSDPRRYAELLQRLSRSQWSLNRGAEAMETAERALSMVPPDEVSAERASLLAWTARIRYLRGRYREALTEGRDALNAAVAAGDRRSESEVLNTLGMAGIVTGFVDEGSTSLRRAIEIAREDDDVDGLGTAYSNLADTLSLAGRTPQALETAKEGLRAVSGRAGRPQDWMTLSVSDLSFEAGDWKAAREYLAQASPGPRLVGRQLMFRYLREADQALGAGDDDTASDRLDELEPLVARSSEP